MAMGRINGVVEGGGGTLVVILVERAHQNEYNHKCGVMTNDHVPAVPMIVRNKRYCYVSQNGR